jgi:hypothetical protein
MRSASQQVPHNPPPPRGRQPAAPLPHPRGRRSRSRSPIRQPPPYSPRKPAHHQVFASGAASSGPSVCTLCLGRHRHDTFRCSPATSWDGSLLRCHRNSSGRLTNPSGLVLCSDWQLPRGCSSASHTDRHECSGCGNKAHGAQNCPRGQKV